MSTLFQDHSPLDEETHFPRFMSVRQVARYLNLNEKKIYALVREDRIPATKITGKWIFPKELIDRWLLETSHGGLMTDRLVIVGSDDPLLSHVVFELAHNTGARALVSYSATGTRLGLSLLAALRADVGGIHWGPEAESQIRHPALLQHHTGHRDWVMVRACQREQGLIVHPSVLRKHDTVSALMNARLRWALRQSGAGSQRFLQEVLARHDVAEDQLTITCTALSEREAAACVAMGEADIAPGVRASATECGMGFVGVGWEAFDFVLNRGVYFRTLFQHLLQSLQSDSTRAYAERLGGYRFDDCGRIVWGME